MSHCDHCAISKPFDHNLPSNVSNAEINMGVIWELNLGRKGWTDVSQILTRSTVQQTCNTYPLIAHSYK